MPRSRRYVSAIVPKIGLHMAKRRRAASADPLGTGDGRCAISGLNRPRDLRASLSTRRQRVEPAVAGDQIEEIAVLAGGGVGPLACGASAGLGAVQANVEAAPRRVLDITDEPVSALPAPVREIMAADGLRLLRETACQFRRRVLHRGLRQKRPAVAGGPKCDGFVGWLLGRDRVVIDRDRLIFGRCAAFRHGQFAAVCRRFCARWIGDDLLLRVGCLDRRRERAARRAQRLG